MDRAKTAKLIKNLRINDICLTDVENELDYRDQAASDMKWDDNLYEYTTEELADIEELWCKV